MKYRITSVALLICASLLGYFLSVSTVRPFKLGLDLAGGVQLLYTAQTREVASSTDIGSAMASLRDVIERRVNMFGVGEPVVQVQRAGALGQGENQLLVELPGVTDIQKAIELIGKTPTLEFKIVKVDSLASSTASTSPDVTFIDTNLTGRYLNRASLQFDPNTNMPIISVSFNEEGQALFAEITAKNIGAPLAIFLDGSIISSPVIREAIRDGNAQITGRFTIAEAQVLVRDLNYGALPLPITLLSTESIGPSLGAVAVQSGIYAGVIGLILLAVFMIAWYRLPGLVAVVALVIYVLISLSVFRLIPVTLTAAGIAGFLLSVGMAVDANVLIFERMKEELRKGKSVKEALSEGFARAWLSIRDSNISSIITAVVLFWLGTSAVKGFALTLGLGVGISMFTALTVSRTFLYALAPRTESKLAKFLFTSGIHLS